MLKPSNKTLPLTSARAGLSRFNVSSAAAAGELCRSQARVGHIDRGVVGPKRAAYRGPEWSQCQDLVAARRGAEQNHSA